MDNLTLCISANFPYFIDCHPNRNQILNQIIDKTFICLCRAIPSYAN